VNASRLLASGLVSCMAIGLAAAVLTLPANGPGVGGAAAEQLPRSGVTNPVTAVLLNYRAWDTLLEIAVLLLAVAAVWSLVRVPSVAPTPPGLLLRALVRLLVPVMIFGSGYLLWAGGSAPGGAFQAGAVLAAAGVLILLAAPALSRRVRPAVTRLLLVLGLAVFWGVAVATLVAGRSLLEYRDGEATAAILLIETAAALSVGATLASLFAGGRPE